MSNNPYYQGGPGWQKRSREHPHDHGTAGRDGAWGDGAKPPKSTGGCLLLLVAFVLAVAGMGLL